MKFSITAGAVALLSATGAMADLTINNYCGSDLYLFEANPQVQNNRDLAPNGDTHPAQIAKGSSSRPSVLTLPFKNPGAGTSFKIAKNSQMGQILQFEICSDCWDGFDYFDLSNLDGKGSGLVGTPFAADNVFVKTTGATSTNCHDITCPANTVCAAAYQAPNDSDTLTCPGNTSFSIDLCAPRTTMRKRNDFDHLKHMRRHQTAAARASQA